MRKRPLCILWEMAKISFLFFMVFMYHMCIPRLQSAYPVCTPTRKRVYPVMFVPRTISTSAHNIDELEHIWFVNWSPSPPPGLPSRSPPPSPERPCLGQFQCFYRCSHNVKGGMTLAGPCRKSIVTPADTVELCVSVSLCAYVCVKGAYADMVL